MKAKKCAAVFFMLMFILNAALVNKAGSQYADNTIFIDPPSIVDLNIMKGDSVVVGINISNVRALNSWQVKIRYNPALLYASLIDEGSFLQTRDPNTDFYKYVGEDYLLIGCSLPQGEWMDGNSTQFGYLATITFTVLRYGETRLEILSDRTKLERADGTTIPHTSQDGYFRNVAEGLTPIASFFNSPTSPLWFENVTFNASSSIDPDGINRYLWFFGDKNLTTQKENTANETDPITYHQYLKTTPEPEKSFTVRLIVIDNTGMTGNISARVVTVASSREEHDLAIINVSVNSTSVEPSRTLAITVYVENQGSSSETFNVTVYYDSISNDTKTDITLNASNIRPINFNWDTTGFPSPRIYTIKASVSNVTGETDITDNTFPPFNVAVTFAPRVSFIYEPASPYVDEFITFDASASTDLDGTIKNYTWDFGEWILDSVGNVRTVENPLIVHTYMAGATYFVTLTVTDDLGAKASTSQWVSILKFPSVISLTVPSEATVRSNSTINGAISPVPSTSKVAILYRSLGEAVWNSLANITTNAQGQFSISWAPSSPGTFEFKAKWDGDKKYSGSESGVKVIVAKYGSSVSLFANPSRVTVGSDVMFTGSISPARSGAYVTILYRIGDGPWNAMGNTTTDQEGNYLYRWKPTTVGLYEVKAMWDGDEITHGGESDVARVEVAEPFDYFLLFAVASIIAVVAVATFLLLRFRKRRGTGVDFKDARKPVRRFHSNVGKYFS